MKIDPKFGVVTDLLTKHMADRGMLVAAGFVAFRKTVMNDNATLDQVQAMQIAFYAGAQHVFHSMMGTWDEGEEPTEDDMARLDKLDSELRAFAAKMELAFSDTEGSA